MSALLVKLVEGACTHERERQQEWRGAARPADVSPLYRDRCVKLELEVEHDLLRLRRFRISHLCGYYYITRFLR